MKPITWMGDSRAALRDFPKEARYLIGAGLRKVQHGEEPANWRPLPTVGMGVNEIRVRLDKAYRVVYVVKFPEAVYVLHAFAKTEYKTPTAEIELASRRYRELLNRRRIP